MNRKERRAQGKAGGVPSDRNAKHLATLHAYAMSAHQQGRLDEARARYEELIRLQPDMFDARKNLAALLMSLGLRAEAEPHLAAAHRLRPKDPDLLVAIGTALKLRGGDEQAIERYREALRVDPGHFLANRNLAMLLQERGENEQALARYASALRAHPNDPMFQNAVLSLRRTMCDWSKYEQDNALHHQLCRAGTSPFTAAVSDLPPAEQLACAQRAAARRIPPQRPAFTHARPSPRERIRIGYLSADYHEHATAYLTAELFERHDRERFEVLGLSYGPVDDSATQQRLRAAFDDWVDLRALNDIDAARAIHAREVDILVDLKGFTRGCRPEIVACRPAPVQVNYLGFPGTMGAPYVDYIVADAVIAPFEQQAFYSERIVHLPHTYQPNDSRREIGPTPSRAASGLPEDAFVFCCFNNTWKLTPSMLDSWARLLRETPGSVLWLLGDNRAAERNLRREAAARGVGPERLVFGNRLPLADHLARHRVADLFLDTLPCNAHTTASDALWAGLPVLTCLGTTFAGRVAGSLLRAVGLPELITSSLEEYEQVALALARDRDRLSAVRERLERNRLTSALFDTPRLAAALEAAYARMWARWQAEAPPEPFAVA